MVKSGINILLFVFFGTSQASLLYETDYRYDALSQIIQLQNNSLIQPKVMNNFSYSYNQNSDITSLTKSYSNNPALTADYAYDSQDRLISDAETAKGVTTTTRYGFDLQSNLRQERTSNNLISRVYNNRNELVVINGNQPLTLSYDAAGNRMLDSTGQHYSYNALDELTNYNSSLERTTYTYDGNAERLSKNNRAGQQSFYYQGLSLINSQDPGQTSLTSYLFGQEREAFIDKASPKFYENDLHGDILQLANNQGQIIANYDYNVYGKPKESLSVKDSNPYRYAGYFYDVESGLYYLNARYYDDKTETFINEDTMIGGKAGYNRYLYVKGNPVMGRDLTGHMFDTIPGEVLRMLLEHLSAKQKLAVARVAKIWAFLVKTYPEKDFLCARIEPALSNVKKAIFLEYPMNNIETISFEFEKIMLEEEYRVSSVQRFERGNVLFVHFLNSSLEITDCVESSAKQKLEHKSYETNEIKENEYSISTYATTKQLSSQPYFLQEKDAKNPVSLSDLEE